jgi:hypothetical protein
MMGKRKGEDSTESLQLGGSLCAGYLLAGDPFFVFLYPSSVLYRPFDHILHVRMESLARFWRDMQRCFPRLQGIYLEPDLARKRVLCPPPLHELVPDMAWVRDAEYLINARRALYHVTWTLSKKLSLYLLTRLGSVGRAHAVTWTVLFGASERPARSTERVLEIMRYLKRALEKQYIDGFFLLCPASAAGLHVAAQGFSYYWGDMAASSMAGVRIEYYRFYPPKGYVKAGGSASIDIAEDMLYFWRVPIQVGTY